jgi:hypothetical protein
LFHEEEKEKEVVGMEYLVSPADVGMQVFLFFRTRSRWGWNILCTFRMLGWNVWGLRRRRRRRSRWGWNILDLCTIACE